MTLLLNILWFVLGGFLVSIAFTPLISLLALALMPVGAPAEAATTPADGDADEAGEEADG